MKFFDFLQTVSGGFQNSGKLYNIGEEFDLSPFYTIFECRCDCATIAWVVMVLNNYFKLEISTTILETFSGVMTG